MLIDLSSIDHESVVRTQKLNRIRFKLNKMTLRRLREFARSNHIPLAGASNKQDVVQEIVSQYGHVWNLEEEEIG